MIYKLFFIALFIGALFITSCATVIKDLGVYRNTDAPRSRFAPPPDKIKSQKTKIVIYAIEDKKVDSKKSAVSRLVTNKIKSVLSETNVSIVDRSALETFSEEAILAAAEGKGDEADIIVAADYAIKGQIDAYAVFASYNPPYTTETESYSRTDDDGSVTYVPPRVINHPARCVYQGSVSGQFYIYVLPSLELIKTVQLNGSANKSVNAGSAPATSNDLLNLGIWIISDFNTPAQCKNKSLQAATLNDSAQNSISYKNRIAILNQFAARGYVNSVFVHKNDEDDFILRVTLGSNNGVKQETELEIYRVSESIDALSGKKRIEERKIADAKVSNLVENDEAWAVIKDEEQALKILTGDLVKVKYKEKFFKSY